MEIRMRPQTPREQFEPEGDPYVLRGRQWVVEDVTRHWHRLPEWVSVVRAGPGQGKSTLLRALARRADVLGHLPIQLDPLRLKDLEHVRHCIYEAMRAHQQRAPGDVQRKYPNAEDELPFAFGSDCRGANPYQIAGIAIECGWNGAVVLADDANMLTGVSGEGGWNIHTEGVVYEFDERLNSGSNNLIDRDTPGTYPVCLVLVGAANLGTMMNFATYSRLAQGCRADCNDLDEPTAKAIIRDHLDVADADGVRPAAVPAEWITGWAAQHRTHVRDLAAVGHYVQAEGMAAARAGLDAVPADAFDRIEANVQAAQVADCARRVEQLEPLELLVAYALGQAAAERDNRVKVGVLSNRWRFVERLLRRVAECEPTLVPVSEKQDERGWREFYRMVDNRLLNAGVVDEAINQIPVHEDDFWSMGTPALGPWLEQRRLAGLAQAVPADRWRWDWTPDIWAAFRDPSMIWARSNDENVPEAAKPDPAETTAAPPRVPELPIPAEVPPWGSESTTN